MAVNVIDFLETVEIDGKKRGVCAQRNMTRATIEMFDEGCPVGNAGQRIMQRKMAIAGDRLLGGLGVDDISGKPQRQQQQRYRNGASAHDGRRQQIFRNDDARVEGERHGGHAGIMHRRYRQDQKRHRAVLAEPIDGPRDPIDCNGAQHCPQHEGRDDIVLIPESHALNIVGRHAGVVHGCNAETKDDPAGFHQHAASAIGRNSETGSRCGNRNQK